MIFTVKIRYAPSLLAVVTRSIEAESSTAALKLGLTDFERRHSSLDVRQVTVSVKKAPK